MSNNQGRGDRGIDTGRSTQGAPLNVEDLYGYLEGTWQFERKVHDTLLGQEGDCIGVAQFYANGNTLNYEEEGELTMGEIVVSTERTYLYKFIAPSMAEVRFSDGRFFHVLDLTKGMVRVEHQCGEDTYHGVYRVVEPRVWLSVWRIIGPRKSQVITTRYLRVTAN